MRRMSALHQNSRGIGKSIPDSQEISWDPRDFPRAKPKENPEGLVLVEYGYILFTHDLEYRSVGHQAR